MSDMFDRAQDREAEMRDDALADQRRRAALPDEEPSDVCKCGEPIPEARQLAIPGITTCISCQLDIERRARCSRGNH